MEEVHCVVCGVSTGGKCDNLPVCFDCYDSGRLLRWLEAGQGKNIVRFKDINTITTSQWHCLTLEQRNAHDTYWHLLLPGTAWFRCPGCGYPTSRGMYCGDPSCPPGKENL